MKKIILFAGLVSLLFVRPTICVAADFDEAHRFIFYAVLEGCYEDGISTKDVKQILLVDTNIGPGHVHFVYACPICTPVVHALEAYLSRPEQFSSLKKRTSTFGDGLDAEREQRLFSHQPAERLAVVNSLMQNWVKRRMTQLRLTQLERDELLQSFAKMRKEGMKYFGLTGKAFGDVKQCALCNGACGVGIKVEDGLGVPDYPEPKR